MGRRARAPTPVQEWSTRLPIGLPVRRSQVKGATRARTVILVRLAAAGSQSNCPPGKSKRKQRTMQIGDAPDYIVLDRFEGDDQFWETDTPTETLKCGRLTWRNGLVIYS